MATEETQLAVLTDKVDRISQDMKEMKNTLNAGYVTKEEFKPIRLFVYGLIAICLVTIATAIISGVVHPGAQPAPVPVATPTK